MLVKRDELLKALKFVSMAVNSKETAAQTSFFMFTKKHIVADNEILHICYPFETGIEGAVRAEELMGVLSKITAPSMEMEVEDDAMVFHCGKATTGLSLYPLLREKVAYLKPIEESKSLKFLFNMDTEIQLYMEACAPCCSANLSERSMSAVHITSDHMEASDNFSAIRADVNIESLGNDEVLIPAPMVAPLIELGLDTEVWRTDDYVLYAKNKDGVWLLFDLIDSTENHFPDISFLFDEGGSTEIHFPEGFLEAVKKSEVFAKNSVRKDEVYVKVKLSPSNMRVSGEGMNGFYREDFDTDLDIAGEFETVPSTLAFMISKPDMKSLVFLDEEPHRIKFAGNDISYIIVVG